MSIGLALLLTAAASDAAPVQAHDVPEVTVGARRTYVHKAKRRSITVFAAPARPIDLRTFRRSDDASRLISARPTAPSYAIRARSPKPDEFWVSTLIAQDVEARSSGIRPRRPGMAAGLSLRMTNDDGMLASQVGMAGSLGKALGRIASEAFAPD